MSSDESDLTPESIKLDALGIVHNLLPEKSKEKYLKAYNDFDNCKSAKSVSESVFLVYFQHLSSTKKSSLLYVSTLLRPGNEVNDLISKESSEKYKNALPIILNNVFKANKDLKLIEDRMRWVVSYMTKTKKNRSFLTLYAYEVLENPKNITEESMFQLYVRTWSLEAVNVCLEMIDDVIDDSDTRWGDVSWHKEPGVGELALNDTQLLRSLAYEMLKHNIPDRLAYAEAVDWSDLPCLNTSIGQHLDLSISQKRPDYSGYTFENFKLAVKYKASFNIFNYPILLAMRMSKKTNPESEAQLEDICMDIGIRYQMQNDYIDCFTQSAVPGTGEGTDIETGKCTWLALMALERCSPAQRALFNECYASKNSAHVKRIKELYKELEIPKLYKEQSKQYRDKIVSKAQSLSGRSTLKPEIFIRVLDWIERQYA